MNVEGLLLRLLLAQCILLNLLAISRIMMPCSVAISGVVLPTVPDIHRREKNRHGFFSASSTGNSETHICDIVV